MSFVENEKAGGVWFKSFEVVDRKRGKSELETRPGPTATLINFTRLSINNSRVVAFSAEHAEPLGDFTGTGGPLTKEGTMFYGNQPFVNDRFWVASVSETKMSLR